MNVQLMKTYQHKIDQGITAVPFAVLDNGVEMTLNKHGTLETGVMALEDFLEQFVLLEVTDA